jgi:SAM-dependent methyltransferase
MLKREVVEDIAVLLRGFFAVPVISSLGRLGALDVMRSATSFTADDLVCIANKQLLNDTFRYLLRIGLLQKEDGLEGAYAASELGKEVFRRANSFYVPHSYYEYMYHYHQMLQDPSVREKCKVERLENVIGSGITHQRYFPPAISFLKRKADFNVLVDIGCGDGQFLLAFLKAVSVKKVIGIDLSEVSTKSTYENVSTKYPHQPLVTICSDALDVAGWSRKVLEEASGAKVAISMWFLLHEISRNDPANLVEFFCRIHEVFPESLIVAGEVVMQSDEILVRQNEKSLMPEYLFFHEMSEQGILSWSGYREALAAIPYTLVFERLFDEASDARGNKMPSTFVWGLMPK